MPYLQNPWVEIWSQPAPQWIESGEARHGFLFTETTLELWSTMPGVASTERYKNHSSNIQSSMSGKLSHDIVRGHLWGNHGKTILWECWHQSSGSTIHQSVWVGSSLLPGQWLKAHCCSVHSVGGNQLGENSANHLLRATLHHNWLEASVLQEREHPFSRDDTVQCINAILTSCFPEGSMELRYRKLTEILKKGVIAMETIHRLVLLKPAE